MNLEQIETSEQSDKGAYRKNIEATSTGMVVAKVFSADGRCVGLEFFSNFFRSSPAALEKNFKKAHKWDDRVIELCEEWEEEA